jgi:Flp pilus assembly protein TadG
VAGALLEVAVHNWNQVKAGQAIIEFALVLPLLVLLIIGVFDLGNAVFTNNTLENAAREGARVGVIESKTDDQIRARVRAAAPNLDLSDPRKIPITPSPSRTFDKPITVTINYVYQPITPFIGLITGGGIHMSASSSMIVEGVIEVP